MDDCVFYLDSDGSVLCPECAEESREHWIETFRPVSGPHLTGSEGDYCEECAVEIGPSEES